MSGDSLEFPAREEIRLEREEIIDGSEPVKKLTGVYFLVDGREIVYVGQSKSMRSRVQYHWQSTDKTFCSAYFLEVPEHLLDDVEEYYIQRFWPRYNKTLPGLGHLEEVDIKPEATAHLPRPGA